MLKFMIDMLLLSTNNNLRVRVCVLGVMLDGEEENRLSLSSYRAE